MSFALPDKMIAIEIKEAGGPEVLMPTKRDFGKFHQACVIVQRKNFLHQKNLDYKTP